MSDDMVVLERLPAWILVALMTPTMLVGVVAALYFLHMLPWTPDSVLLAVAWAFSTLPLVLVALGLKAMDRKWRPGPDPAVEEALAALEDAAEAVQAVHRYLKEEGVIPDDMPKELKGGGSSS